jgi:hypothetical protein
MSRALWILFMVVVLGLLTVSVSTADQVSETAQQLMNEHQDALVKVKLVVKQSVFLNGQAAGSKESKLEFNGVVLDPCGLTVISLSSFDAASRLGDLGREGLEVKTEVSNVKITVINGIEVGAKVILRDNDLDLAFVAPEEKTLTPFVFIDFSKGVAVNLMDPIYVLSRFGKIAKQALMVNKGRVNAVISTPRLFYISQGVGEIGSPIFSEKRELVGLVVVRFAKGKSDSTGMGSAFSSLTGESSMLPIILTAGDILEVAQQAKELYEKGESEVKATESTSTTPEESGTKEEE